MIQSLCTNSLKSKVGSPGRVRCHGLWVISPWARTALEDAWLLGIINNPCQVLPLTNFSTPLSFHLLISEKTSCHICLSWKSIITDLRKIENIHLNFIIKCIINCFQDKNLEISQMGYLQHSYNKSKISSFIEIFIDLFTLFYHDCAWCLQRPWEDIRSHGNGVTDGYRATMWVLAIKPVSFGRAASAVTWWTTSTDPDCCFVGTGSHSVVLSDLILTMYLICPQTDS